MCNATSPQSQSQMKAKNGFAKIAGVCKQARKDGYEWIWIDSCCIDKSSSAELQETINSMWRYYEESNICYVYLADVTNEEAGWSQTFAESEWFTRGWTLQELIAPVCVEFYAADWALIGTKLQRYNEIAKITSIDPDVLIRVQTIGWFSAAERLSWASHRNVTREEDEAYSLLGLFDINMPLLYGEGRRKAFVRLQQAIYNAMPDDTIFLFRHSKHKGIQPLLTSSLANFCDRPSCEICPSQEVWHASSMFRYHELRSTERWAMQAHEQIMTTLTNSVHSTSTVLPLLPYGVVSHLLRFSEPAEDLPQVTHVAILNYTMKAYPQGALCLLLLRVGNIDASDRQHGLPAILPDLGDLSSQLEKTKLIFSTLQSTLEDSSHIETVFSLDSGSLHVDEWHVQDSGGDPLPLVHPRRYSNHIFPVEESPNSKTSLPVWYQISCSDLNMVLRTKLVRLHDVWSIRAVVEGSKEIFRGGFSFPSRTSFHSNILVDRCVVELAQGTKLSLTLRRLPGAARTSGSSVVKECYQISVDRVGRSYSPVHDLA